MSAVDDKQDKYEQLLARIDWHAPRPPKGYQYGVGRGAKAFITTAELTTVGATGAKMTRDENDFFSAMERLEEGRGAKKRTVGNSNREDDEDGRDTAREKQGSAGAPAKLSLDDLATLELPAAGPSSKATMVTATSSSSTAAAAAAAADALGPRPAPADPATSAPTTTPAPGLVVRSARTEEGEAAEEHVFAEERVLTAYDVLKGKTSAVQAGLHNVLAMGSTEEQTTWITHARAYREMGMTRRAYQTLVDGCAVTGKKGKRIWEERLRYLARDNVAGRRRLLDEATAACPSEEELWMQLLDVVPPLERVPCLQRAVLACPSSEHLWLKLVQFVPSIQDQRVLLQRALQHTPHLPLLWARLARLENVKTGKEMFQAAAERFPSLALVIEAAKYVEWYALSHSADANAAVSGQPAVVGSVAQLQRSLRSAGKEVGELVRTAQQNYLTLGEAGSRHAWLSMALSLLQASEADGAATSHSAGDDAANSADAASSSSPLLLLSQPCVYVCTAAYMFLTVVDPHSRGFGPNAVPTTWLSDLVALFPAGATAQHEVQCALWYTWLLLQQDYAARVAAQQQQQQQHSSRGGEEEEEGGEVAEEQRRAAVAVAAVANSREPLQTLDVAVLSAPPTVLQGELLALLAPWKSESRAKNEAGDEELAVKREGGVFTSCAIKIEKRDEEQEEEEEEELRTLGARAAPHAPRPASAPSAASSSLLSSSPAAHRLPAPLAIAVAATLSLATRLPDTHSPSSPSSFSSPSTAASAPVAAAEDVMHVEVPLTLSAALSRRGCHAAALAVVDAVLPARHSAPAGVLDSAQDSTSSRTRTHDDTGDLRLHVTRAKLLSALGDDAAADHCLLEAINATTAQAQQSSSRVQEEAWVKLAVLRRSHGQPIDGILQDALGQCPRSWRLWLMLLEEKRRSIAGRQQALSASLPAARGAAQGGGGADGRPSASTSTPAAAAAARPTVVEMVRVDDALASEVREVRALCARAVAADHCRAVAAVWVFVALRIEAELLQNVSAARALLTDAATACAAAIGSPRSQLLARSLTPRELERQASAFAQLGVAQATLDVQFGTPGQALETVQEVLQRLPKTRDGTLTLAEDGAVGELLGLFIALEPPASRGRAAATVMRQWKSREPLALCAVAQLYYTAGQYERAVEQAVKAVQASKGRCGDAAGLLWRMADQAAVHRVVRKHLSAAKEGEEGEKTDGEGKGADGREGGATAGTADLAGQSGADEVLSPAEVQQWVLSVMAAAAFATAATGESGAAALLPPAAGSGGVAEAVVPNSGPLWLTVAKAEDATNVLLRGYRRPVVEMLRDVANRTTLVGPGSVTAAPLRDL